MLLMTIGEVARKMYNAFQFNEGEDGQDIEVPLNKFENSYKPGPTPTWSTKSFTPIQGIKGIVMLSTSG